MGSDRPRVGPVLVAERLGEAVAEAICAENPDARVVDRGGYLRVSVPGRCSLTRAAVERLLGEPFSLPSDLERVMASFAGRLALSHDRVEWALGERRDDR